MLNGPGNPNLKLLCRQNVWLKSYGYFCASWEKKLTPSFLNFCRQISSFCTLFKKNLGLLDPSPGSPPKKISLYGNSRTTHRKNFGVAFFDLAAISMPKNNIVSLVKFCTPLVYNSRLRFIDVKPCI